MTMNEATRHIRNGTKWTLVMHYKDGEFGCLDATKRAAEQVMCEQEDSVVGIYLRKQSAFLRTDVESRANPAWRKVA